MEAHRICTYSERRSRCTTPMEHSGTEIMVGMPPPLPEHPVVGMLYPGTNTVSFSVCGYPARWCTQPRCQASGPTSSRVAGKFRSTFHFVAQKLRVALRWVGHCGCNRWTEPLVRAEGYSIPSRGPVRLLGNAVGPPTRIWTEALLSIPSQKVDRLLCKLLQSPLLALEGLGPEYGRAHTGTPLPLGGDWTPGGVKKYP